MSDKFDYTNPEINRSSITRQPDEIQSSLGQASPRMTMSFNNYNANTYLLNSSTDDFGCFGELIFRILGNFAEVVAEACIHSCSNADCNC
ncbi:unnamed protein product [Caenorhabditis brenneri]